MAQTFDDLVLMLADAPALCFLLEYSKFMKSSTVQRDIFTIGSKGASWVIDRPKQRFSMLLSFCI